MRRILCGTPKANCSGSVMQVSAWLGGVAGQKVHSDSPEAFKCYARYLVNELGYERLGSREFRTPDMGILVITKQTRFGAELRGGKRGQKLQAGDRVMPKNKRSGVLI